jgi:hypothetical protein
MAVHSTPEPAAGENNMQANPALFVVWAVFGLIIGAIMYFILGGNPYIHLVIGVIAGIFGGAYGMKMKNRK